MKTKELREAWDWAIEALRVAARLADELAPCAEQSRIREALTALGTANNEVSEQDTDEDCGTLCDYHTGAAYGSATREQRDASREAAKSDGGAGVIAIDGRTGHVISHDQMDSDSITCYVEE